MSQLFRFIKADLTKHEANATKAVIATESESSATDGPLTTSSNDPHFPKSLYLIRPLHARELNAVAPQAQKTVGIPNGLNLDAPIVPSSRLKHDPDSASEEEGENIAPSNGKKRKGKSKAEGESKGKSKGTTKRKKKDASGEPIPADTPEEIAAREQVHIDRHSWTCSACFLAYSSGSL